MLDVYLHKMEKLIEARNNYLYQLNELKLKIKELENKLQINEDTFENTLNKYFKHYPS